jgi:hypothetical protein
LHEETFSSTKGCSISNYMNNNTNSRRKHDINQTESELNTSCWKETCKLSKILNSKQI